MLHRHLKLNILHMHLLLFQNNLLQRTVPFKSTFMNQLLITYKTPRNSVKYAQIVFLLARICKIYNKHVYKITLQTSIFRHPIFKIKFQFIYMLVLQLSFVFHFAYKLLIHAKTFRIILCNSIFWWYYYNVC